MDYIEKILVINNTDIKNLNSMQLIAFVMEEVEKSKNLKGIDKKNKVIEIMKEFVNNNDNIFIKSENTTIINNLNLILNNELISDIIENILTCAEGTFNFNTKIKSRCFCFKS